MRAQPNIVLVMADQYVPFLSGLMGCSAARTPNLARLAQSGVTFETAYCNYPVCSPSRASLLTGQYASDVGAFDNASILRSDVPTLAHYLALAGYDTALSGKMHFIGPDQHHGFGARLTTDIFPSSLAWLPSREGPTRFVHPNNPDGPPIAIDYVTAGPTQWNEQLQYDEEVHSRALEFLRSRRTRPQGSLQVPAKKPVEDPFFLCVSYHHPHEPFQPPIEYWRRFSDVDIPIPGPSDRLPRSVMDDWVDVLHGVADVDLSDKQVLQDMRRAYLALQAYIDDKIGELVSALEESGLRDDTVIIFTSDHGDMLGERGMVQKRVFYEWSSRVPLVISAPSRYVAGRRLTSPVSLVDLFPTVCDIAAADAPSFAGRSLMPALEGRAISDEPVFVEYHSEGVYAPCFMVRDGSFKYTYIHGHGEQLFDVINDSEETVDLATDSRFDGTREKLRALILGRFHPADIEARIRQSLDARRVLRQANIRSGTRWDYLPSPELFTKYWRG